MSYAKDKLKQALGEYACRLHYKQGHMKNPYDSETQPMEWYGYYSEQERIESLELLLSEQAGEMGL